MKRICQEQHLLQDEEGLVRVPFLVKGQLITPPKLSRQQVEAAFASSPAGVGYIKLAGAQLLREALIDPEGLRWSGEYRYQVLPPLDPAALVETDFDRLLAGPYALSVEQVLDYLGGIADVLRANWDVVDGVRALVSRTSPLPQAFVDGAFAGLLAGLDPQAGRIMVDRELAFGGLPGSRFLDGWVEVPGQIFPGLGALLAGGLPGGAGAANSPAVPTLVRAMPTRQLHITAGNAPQVPLVSALRLVLTKSAGVIKFPAEATLAGALLALAAYRAAPDHPLTRNLSAVYWQGGDAQVEQVLFAPGAFDRVVVWGAPQAVASVYNQAGLTRVVSFNPRYGVSLIGREAFSNDLESVAVLAAQDALIYNQQSCSASLVQYIEANLEDACRYARCLQAALAQWDEAVPQILPAERRGQLKRLRRGKYSGAEWFLNLRDNEFASGVVVMPGEFDILDHPLSRLVVVRPLAQLDEALAYLHAGVAMAGVFPEGQRAALREAIAARGVSSIFPLGQCERLYAGIPQDGMLTLSELVDWKNG